jgi:hypothetical protein
MPESPKLAEVNTSPAKELKHFLDAAADAATAAVQTLDAEWVALAEDTRRLIRMAKALQTSAGLTPTRRKRPKSVPVVVAPTPAPVTPVAPDAANPTVAATPAVVVPTGTGPN